MSENTPCETCAGIGLLFPSGGIKEGTFHIRLCKDCNQFVGVASAANHVLRTLHAHEQMLETLQWSRERLVRVFGFGVHGEVITKLDAAIAAAAGGPDG